MIKAICFSKSVIFFSYAKKPITYSATQIPVIRSEQSVERYGNSLKEFSSPRLFTARTSAQMPISIDVTPALPRYMLPLPQLSKELTTAATSIPMEIIDKKSAATPLFECVFSVNLYPFLCRLATFFSSLISLMIITHKQAI